MDFKSVNLDPIYAIFGVEVEIACVFGNKYILTAIDKTNGVEVSGGNMGHVDVGTISPMMAIRMNDLTNINLRPVDLEGGIVTMNNKEWTIKNYIVRPNPNGELAGEVYFVLMDASNE